MKHSSIPDINLSNYEEYLLLHIDGELNAGEEAAWQDFLATHPEIQAEVDAFRETVVPVPDALTCDFKERLYQPEPRKKTFPLRPMLWAATAGLALWSILPFLQKTSEPPATAARPQNPPQPAPSLPETTVVPNPTPAQVPAMPAVPAPETTLASARHQATASRSNAVVAIPTTRSTQKNEQSDLPKATSGNTDFAFSPIPELPMRERPLLVSSSPLLVAEPVAAILPAVPTMLPGEERESRVVMDFPLLRDVHEQAKERLRKIQAAGNELRNTEATLVIANRKVLTLRF